MKKSVVIGGVVVILAAGAAALPFYTGVKAEQSVRADHEMMAQEILFPGLEIALADYQRGWLAAEATTTITFAPEAGGEPLILEVHHHISHLPSLTDAAIASVTSELVLPAKWRADADRVLNGQAPLTVVSRIGLTGTESATISSPAFKTTLEGGAVTLEWKGLQGSGSENRDNSHMTANLTMPGLYVSGAQGNFTLNEIRYDLDMERGSYDMWFGKSNASLKSLQFSSTDASDTHQLAINNVRFNTEQKERGTVTDGNGVVQVGKSTFDDMTLDSAVYDFEFRNIDTKTMHDIQSAIQHSYAGGDPSQLGAVMLGAVPALLKAKPEINIRRLELTSSLGNFIGKLHLAFVGEWNDSMAGNPLAVVAMLNADLDLAMSKSLLLAITQSQMRSTMVALAQMQGEALSDAEIEAMASERAAQQLEMMEANGYLEPTEQGYATKLHFEKGQLTINGKAANEFFGTAQ